MKDNLLVNINEVFSLIQIYHFLCFTQFNLDNMRQYEMGYSMVINMAIMLAINVGFMVFKSLNDCLRKRRLDKIKQFKIT